MQISLSRVLGAVALAAAVTAAASSFAQAAASSGPSSIVVYVGGNDLVIKAADGKLLNYSVAAGTKFTVGDRQETLAELKPGMKLTKEVSTGFDPQIVSGVKVVKGKVFAVTPPDAVSLLLADGIKELTVPSGTTFMVDGKPMTIKDLKPEMMVEATVVTTIAEDATPEVANAPAPPAPAMAGVLLVAKTAGSGESSVPLAGTNLPLYGLIGACLLAVGLGMMLWRRPVREV
jgi:hypothetical protein